MKYDEFEHSSGLSLVVVALESELPGHLPDNYIKLVTGVGKINASIALTRALLSGSYDCVYNFGSAGGLPEFQGQLLPINKILQRDMNCSPLGVPRFITPGEDNLHITTDNLRLFGKEHICSSGDSFIIPTEEHPIVDMESYALAKVCKQFSVSFFCYKYISDSGCSEDWTKNHNKGAELFRKKVCL